MQTYTADLDTIFSNQKNTLLISKTLNSKQLPIRTKIKRKYLPQYRHKLNLDRKKILPSSEDRLNELTIKQIDRLIEMQKIKDLLNDNKMKIKPTHICSLQKHENRHPNVYQPNFLAAINRIAIQRNIRHLRSEQFDEITLTPQQLRQKGLLMQKKNLRFVKQYKADEKKKKPTLTYQQEQQKSISSIQDNLQEFEKKLKQKKQFTKPNKQETLKKFRQNKTNILSATRWFNGMSTFYLDFEERNKRKEKERLEGKTTCVTNFNRDFDFDNQLNEEVEAKNSKNSFGIKYSRLSTVA